MNFFAHLFYLTNTLLLAVNLHLPIEQPSFNSPKKTPLIFGMSSGDAPFMNMNAQGAYEGFDVDVAQEIGKLLNRDIKIIDMHLPELFIALNCRRIDAVMSGLNITSKRQELFTMIHYQGSDITKIPVVFWKQAPNNIQTIHDCQQKNLTIAVLSGTLQEDFLKQLNIPTKSLSSNDKIILELQFGKVDAALFDESLEMYLPKFNHLKIVEVPLLDTFKVAGHGIALHKENTELALEIKKAIKTLKNNGTLTQLEKAWNLS